MSELPIEVDTTLNELAAGLNALEAQVDRIVQMPPLREIQERAAPLDSAQLNVSLAYTLDSLYYIYLRTLGESAEGHEVKKELERVRGYMRKLKQAEQELKEPASQPTLDQATAERFVRHAIGQPASAAGAGQSDDMEISTTADTSVAESAQAGRRKGRALQPAKKSGPEMGGTARSLAVAPSAHVIWNELQQKGGLSSDELVEQFLKKTSGSS